MYDSMRSYVISSLMSKVLTQVNLCIERVVQLPFIERDADAQLVKYNNTEVVMAIPVMGWKLFIMFEYRCFTLPTGRCHENTPIAAHLSGPHHKYRGVFPTDSWVPCCFRKCSSLTQHVVSQTTFMKHRLTEYGRTYGNCAWGVYPVNEQVNKSF